MELRRFTPTALFVCAGLLIWAADFLLVYVIAAIACAKGFAGVTVLGLPFVAVVGTVLTLAACLATAVVLRIGVRHLQANGSLGQSVRFIYFLAAAIGAISLIAILFNAIPAWVLGAQCG
jgi:hypothetical protein